MAGESILPERESNRNCCDSQTGKQTGKSRMIVLVVLVLSEPEQLLFSFYKRLYNIYTTVKT